jgi:hypothetical protein
MVKGLIRFKKHFREEYDSFVIIGGVACEVWMASKSLPFRTTKDLDMVLVLEVLDTDFIKKFWAFIKDGEYQIRQKSEKRRDYYRFYQPLADDYPGVIELFSRRLDSVMLDSGQTITPIPMGEDLSSLSAILMDDDYYHLLTATRVILDDLPVISAEGLIPLKAKAWLDLKERKAKGEPIDENDIRKHMKDVFKLTVTLTGSVFPLTQSIKADLQNFADCFPTGSDDWAAIMVSMREAGMAGVKSVDLRASLVQHFGLTRDPRA